MVDEVPMPSETPGVIRGFHVGGQAVCRMCVTIAEMQASVSGDLILSDTDEPVTGLHCDRCGEQI